MKIIKSLGVLAVLMMFSFSMSDVVAKGKSDKSDKSEKSQKSDKSDKSDKSGKSGKSGKSDKSDKSKKSDKDDGNSLSIVEAIPLYLDVDNNGIPDGDATLTILGPNLCLVNGSQQVSLGTTGWQDQLPVLSCTFGADPDRGLDAIVATLPFGLATGSYTLTVDNGGSNSDEFGG